MSVKKICIAVLFVTGTYSCLYQTFNNTSVTLSGVKKPIDKISGCFEPDQDIAKVSLIQILNETVPVLYEGAFNNLQFLLDIVLLNDNIQKIEAGAFKNLPQIYSIKINNNRIKQICDGVFNTLLISELNLVNNSIEVIDSKAFDNVPNLSIILLSNNKLTTWDPNWFTATPKVNALYFENNNIKNIPSKAFQNIHGLHQINHLNISTSIHLNGNRIEHIDNDAFEGLTVLGWLFLQHNRLREFNEHSLGHLQQLDWLRLDHNNLECVPEKLVKLVPNVKYYLDGNPLSNQCIEKYDIKRKSNGWRPQFRLEIEKSMERV